MSLPGTADEIWQLALKSLQTEVSRSNFSTWLRDTVGISFHDGVFTIGTSQPFALAWLETRLSSLVQKTIISMTGEEVEVRFQLLPAANIPRHSASYANSPHGSEAPGQGPYHQLNPRYTLDNFVTGDCNRVAWAAAVGVAEAPGSSYNPLFIHSGVGLGKTHLLHAIGNAGVRQGWNVLCTTSEQFTNEFVEAIKGRDISNFRNKYRTPDVLLIDDVNFIGGKERTQDSFCHTFNELYQANHQIVVTSDRPPKSLTSLGKQLSSRLEGGLVVGLQLPMYKTRLEILRAKAGERDLPVRAGVLEFIAENCQQSIRELEGALNRLSALASATRVASITLDLAQQALFDVQPSSMTNRALSTIVALVADHCNLSVDDLVGRKRLQNVVQARQLAMYLARTESYHSLVQIGAFFGGRDHTTVLHSCRKIEKEAESDSTLRQSITDLHTILQEKT